MKQYKYFFYLLSIVATIGCSNKSDDLISYDSFPTTENIHLAQVNLPDTTFMRYPCQLAMSSSYIFILDLNPTEYFVQCYSYPAFEYVCSLFKRGQGPDEYILIDNIQCSNDTLLAYESKNAVHYVATQNISQNISISKTVKFSNNFGFLRRGVKVDTCFYFPAFSTLQDNRLLAFGNNGSFNFSFGKIRANQEDIDAATLQGWMSWLAGNEEILVTATQFGEVLDIYSLKDKKKQLTLKGKGDFPVFQKHQGYGVPTGIRGFESIAVTNNYILAVYNGEKMSEGAQSRQGGQYIYMYDYNGTPLKKIVLDQFVSSIYVDESAGIMYALSVNTDQPLFKAKLPSMK